MECDHAERSAVVGTELRMESSTRSEAPPLPKTKVHYRGHCGIKILNEDRRWGRGSNGERMEGSPMSEDGRGEHARLEYTHL